MNPTSEPSIERVTLNGDPWVHLIELPRPIAESIRRLLERYGIPSVLRTPWQWVQATPVIELETGGFMGMVGLFVPEVMQVQASGVLEDAGFLETGPIETGPTETGLLEPEGTD
jgi:hypothetical protein